MDIAFTVFALLCAIGAGISCWDAHRYAQRCENHANRLRAAISRITNAEAHVESLTTQLQKLRGSFFALKAQIDSDGPISPPPPLPESQNVTPLAAAEFCANYGQAQIEGPQSKAAACGCGYCVEMRARRDAARRELVPRTATGQAKLARVNAGQNNGE